LRLANKWIAAAIVLAGLAPLSVIGAPSGTFADFLKDFEAKAVAAGISPTVYERATAGLTPDPKIPALITSQPEFATPIWDYLDARITPGRIGRGKTAMAANASGWSALQWDMMPASADPTAATDATSGARSAIRSRLARAKPPT